MIIAERIRSNVQIAVDTLRANKLRSSLTILGVVIGVSTVMTMAPGCPVDTIGEVDQLVRNCHFDRARLHVWLDKNDMAMNAGLSADRSAWCWQIAIAAKHHSMQTLAGPLAKLAAILCQREQWQFAIGPATGPPIS